MTKWSCVNCKLNQYTQYTMPTYAHILCICIHPANFWIYLHVKIHRGNYETESHKNWKTHVLQVTKYEKQQAQYPLHC